MKTTALYYTGHLPPEPFLQKVRSNLIKAANGLPIISVSHQPIDLGTNISIGEQRKCFYTAQRQMILGLESVKTPYVAFCEDDTLYSYDHLHWIPPQDDVFYYNVNRWTCEDNFYWWASRMNMSQLICNTQMILDYLQQRMQLASGPDDPVLKFFQEPGRTKSRYDHKLGLGGRKSERVSIEPIPLVVFNNKESLRGIRRISDNALFTPNLPQWGNAKTLHRHYKEI